LIRSLTINKDYAPLRAAVHDILNFIFCDLGTTDIGHVQYFVPFKDVRVHFNTALAEAAVAQLNRYFAVLCTCVGVTHKLRIVTTVGNGKKKPPFKGGFYARHGILSIIH